MAHNDLRKGSEASMQISSGDLREDPQNVSRVVAER